MTTFALGNNPTFSTEELGDIVRTVLPANVYSAVDVTDGNTDVVTRMTRYVLTQLARYLHTLHYVEVPVSCQPNCVVDLSKLGTLNITDIQVRSEGCVQSSCLRPLTWWKVRGTEVQVAGCRTGDILRIEFLAPAPVLVMDLPFVVASQDGAPLPAPQVNFNSSVHTDLRLTWPVFTNPERTTAAEEARIPVAGYVRGIDTSRRYVLEYIGRTFHKITGGGEIVLHNVTPFPSVETTVVLTCATNVMFVARLGDVPPLEVIRTMVQAKYWQDALSTCVTDADRAFASQMMVFYSGEREKAMRSVRIGGGSRTTRLKYRPDIGTRHRA